MGLLDKLPQWKTVFCGRTMRTGALIIAWVYTILLGITWFAYMSLFPTMFAYYGDLLINYKGDNLAAHHHSSGLTQSHKLKDTFQSYGSGHIDKPKSIVQSYDLENSDKPKSIVQSYDSENNVNLWRYPFSFDSGAINKPKSTFHIFGSNDSDKTKSIVQSYGSENSDKPKSTVQPYGSENSDILKNTFQSHSSEDFVNQWRYPFSLASGGIYKPDIVQSYISHNSANSWRYPISVASGGIYEPKNIVQSYRSAKSDEPKTTFHSDDSAVGTYYKRVNFMLIGMVLTYMFIVQCLHLWGVLKKKHYFMLPSMLTGFFLLVVYLMVSVTIFIFISLWIFLLPLNSFLCITIYTMMINISYYREVRDEFKRKKNSENAGQSSNLSAYELV